MAYYQFVQEVIILGVVCTNDYYCNITVIVYGREKRGANKVYIFPYQIRKRGFLALNIPSYG